MSSSTYFERAERERDALRRQGFSQWPSQTEAAEYAFVVNDKLEALAAALGYQLRKDYRNRWIVIETRDVS